MIDNTIFKISQLTLPVATVLATAWVLVSGVNGALELFLGGMLVTFLLRILEQSIFEHNRGRFGRYG